MKQLNSPKLHQLLSQQFARDIVAERLPAGTQLPAEPELATTYGVSRPVVREAMRELAAAGLVHTRHGKRTLVMSRSDWDVLSSLVQQALREEGRADEFVHDLYELRCVLEPHAAAWSACRASTTQRDDLRTLLRAMEDTLDSTDPVTAFLDSDRSFHAAIAQAAENRVLLAVLRALHNVVTTSWIRSTVTRDDLPTLLAQHAAIATAIIDGAESEAAEAMQEHLKWAMERERSTQTLDSVDISAI